MYYYDYYNYYYCVRERERERDCCVRESSAQVATSYSFPPNFKGKGLHIFLRARKKKRSLLFSRLLRFSRYARKRAA